GCSRRWPREAPPQFRARCRPYLGGRSAALQVQQRCPPEISPPRREFPATTAPAIVLPSFRIPSMTIAGRGFGGGAFQLRTGWARLDLQQGHLAFRWSPMASERCPEASLATEGLPAHTRAALVNSGDL